eukprot:14947541-Ditylum_brightwellii.AAC.1
MFTIEAHECNRPSLGKKKERKQLLLKGLCNAASAVDSLSEMNSCSHLGKTDNNCGYSTQGDHTNRLPVT